MKIKKEEEEDVSVNSERMGSEDKIFTDKLRIHSDININCIVLLFCILLYYSNISRYFFRENKKIKQKR